jgi:hypothetical protein
MKKPLYTVLASLMGAYHRCIESRNEEWERKHRERIEALVRQYLPSGSGFDTGTKIDFACSTEERLEFDTAFHHMNDVGYYDGWTEHGIIVTPSLSSGFKLRITGRNRRDIKDYIAEQVDHILHEEVEEYEQPAATDTAKSNNIVSDGEGPEFAA